MSDKLKIFKIFYLKVQMFGLIVLLGLINSPAIEAAVSGLGDSPVVVYNNEMPESKEVAMHYARLRAVPVDQVIGFPLKKTETIS